MASKRKKPYVFPEPIGKGSPFVGTFFPWEYSKPRYKGPASDPFGDGLNVFIGKAGTRGGRKVYGKSSISVTIATSTEMQKLIKPRSKGVVSAINQYHRDFANDLLWIAMKEWRESARGVKNRRSIRTGASQMESFFRREHSLGGKSKMIKGIGSDSVIGARGFRVEIAPYMDRQFQTRRGGKDPTFPYWRSLEYGYAPFKVKKAMFRSKGVLSAPSSFRNTDKRLIQNVAFAPFETTTISFAGYGATERALKRYAGKAKSNYVSDALLSALPIPWIEAARLIANGRMMGRPVPTNKKGKLLFVKGGDPRVDGSGNIRGFEP